LEERSILRKIILTGLFAAIAVILSGIYFPVGPTRGRCRFKWNNYEKDQKEIINE